MRTHIVHTANTQSNTLLLFLRIHVYRRIVVAEHSLKLNGESRATTILEDVLLSRAQWAQPVVLDRMERISTLSKVSKRKHDRTHRRWFNDILKSLIGEAAFTDVDLDLSANRLHATKKSRWSENRARHWKPCTRNDLHPDAASCLRMDEVPYLEQLFKDFSKIYNRGMSMTRVCMQVNQLDLDETLGIRPCRYRLTTGFVDTAANRTIHCSGMADGANLYQCDKTSRTLSETFGGKLPYELGVASASLLIGQFFAGCSDKPDKLLQAMDKKALLTWSNRLVTFMYEGEPWTLKKVKETGDMAYLNGITACAGDYGLRSLGSGPFSPAIAHECRSSRSIALRYSIPHVFGTSWKRKLVETRQSLMGVRKNTIGSGNVDSTALLGALDRFIRTELKLIPENLTLCDMGWNELDYGELHAAGTPCNRVLDQEVRLVGSGKGGVAAARLLFGHTATGRGEVRQQYFKVCSCPIIS